MQKLFLVMLVLLFVSCSDKAAKLGEDPSAKGAPGEKTVTVKQDKTAKEIIKEKEAFVETPVDPRDMVSPMQAIKDLDQTLEGYHLGQNLTPEQEEANKKLKRKIIYGTFDIRELCRLSLGRHWHDLTRKQQNYFVDLMTKLLETKAIFSREQLKGEQKLYSLTYKSETYDNKEKTLATVVSKMRVPKEKLVLDITYKMIKTPYGWKIFDVIVDDASLLTNYKFQFDRIITTHGFNELIARMEKKLKEISQ